MTITKIDSRGQLRPLEKRMTKVAQERRGFRVAARLTVAQALQRQMAQTQGVVKMVTEPIRRGFWGRFRWLLFGK